MITEEQQKEIEEKAKKVVTSFKDLAKAIVKVVKDKA